MKNDIDDSVIQYAAQMLRNGYQVIPVNSQGSPEIKYKGEEYFTEMQGIMWQNAFPTSSVGMICGRGIACLDVDVDDDRTARLLLHRIRERHTDFILRTRENSCRFAIFFRFTDDNLGRWVSDTFKDPAGNKHRIEFNSNGVATIFGRHRKENSSYIVGNPSPMQVPVNEIAHLTTEDVLEICDIFESIVPKEWEFKSKRGSFRKGSGSETFDTATGLDKQYTDEEIQSILDRADGSSRDVWLSVGMALDRHYNKSEEGFEIWDTWSQGFPGYRSVADQRYHWDRFNSSGTTTLKSVENRITQNETKKELENIKKSNKYDYREMPKQDGIKALADMLVSYVHIKNGDLVGIIRSDSKPAVSKYREFFNTHRNVTYEIMTGKNMDVPKNVPVVNVWTNHEDKLKAEDVVFCPGQPRIFMQENIGYYNSYCGCGLSIVERRDMVPLFVDHLKYLFPLQGHLWFLNWLAQMIQEPGRRIGRVAPVSISLHQGTGRGWLTRLLSLLVGENNYVTKNDVNDFIRPGAKSGYLSTSVLLNVNEISVGNDRDRNILIDRFKTLLSDNIQEIDVKYGKQSYNSNIFTRLFLQSNYIDGVPITADDTRFQPFICREKPKDYEYYETLYSLLKSKDFLNQVYSYLMKDVKVDERKLQRSVSTSDKRAVISASHSIVEFGLIEFRELIGSLSFSQKQFNDFITRYYQLLYKRRAALKKDTVTQTDLSFEDQKIMDNEWKTLYISEEHFVDPKGGTFSLQVCNYVNEEFAEDWKKLLKDIMEVNKRIGEFFLNV